MDDKKAEQVLEADDTEKPIQEKEEDIILVLKSKLEEKENELQEQTNKLTRLQADFQNYKRRTEKELKSSIAYGEESVLTDLLPIIDNMQRALAANEDKDSQFYKGALMIEKQLADLLESYNVTAIATVGEEFDPNVHHAVTMVESDEPSGTIVEAFQIGYRHNDKVIRPAMVIISK